MTQKNGPLLPLVVAYFAFVTIGMPTGILNIAWRYMQITFDVDLAAFGILSGCGMVGYLLTSFTSGRAIGRLGIANVLVIGSLLGGLGMFGVSLAPTWETLLICVFFSAMGAGFIDAGLNTFVSANYSAGRLNWLHAAYGVGATLGPLLATFVITRLEQSWRINYVIAPGLYLIFFVCLILTRSRWTLAHAESHKAVENAGSAAGVFETLRMPMVVLLVSFFFVYGGLEVSAGQMANPLFVDSRGISQESAGFWIGMYWLTFTIGRVLTGFIADRVTTKLMLRWSMVGVIAGALLLMITTAPAVSFIGLTLMGFAQAPMFATFVAETPRRVGLRYAPTTIGMEIGVTSLGTSFLPGLCGYLAEHISLEIIGPFLLVLAILMVVLHEMVLIRERKPLEPALATHD